MNFLRTRHFGYGVAGCAVAGLTLLLATGIDCARNRLASTSATVGPPPVAVPSVGGTDETEAVGDRLRARVLTAIVRHRAMERMQRDGFALIDKDSTPLTRERARELMDRLDDETLIGCVREASPTTYGKLGDGQLLSNLLTWISEHQEEILAVLKLILAILVLI